jgi:hypothetical protein
VPARPFQAGCLRVAGDHDLDPSEERAVPDAVDQILERSTASGDEDSQPDGGIHRLRVASTDGPLLSIYHKITAS